MKLIHVFSVFGTARSFFDGQFGYLVDKGYQIIVVGGSANDNDISRFAEKNKIRYEIVDIPRSISPKKVLNAIKQLIKLIKRENPNAVVGHTPVGALCAMIAGKIAHVRKRIYYRHGLIYTTMSGIKRVAFLWEERLVSALATDIVNVSSSLSSLAITDRLNRNSKQIVIGSGTCGGIDAINVFNPNLVSNEQIHVYKERYGLLDADIIFGYCGRICKDKGIVELVDGFRLFRKNHTDLKCKLLLIGGRDARDSLTKDKLEDIRADESVVMTGPMDKSELNTMYALMDVFILASYREGFGICVLEASAMEKPILVTKSHGCIDSIIEHQTGEYIELTPQGICVGMEKMLNPNLRYKQGKNGREMVLQKYDYSVTWPLIDDFYKHILA